MEKVSHSAGLGQPVLTHDYFQLAVPQKWGYVEEDRLFVDSILQGTPTAVTAEDGYRAVELVEALSLRAPLPASTPAPWRQLLAGLATTFDTEVSSR